MEKTPKGWLCLHLYWLTCIVKYRSCCLQLEYIDFKFQQTSSHLLFECCYLRRLMRAGGVESATGRWASSQPITCSPCTNAAELLNDQGIPRVKMVPERTRRERAAFSPKPLLCNEPCAAVGTLRRSVLWIL